MSSFVFMRVLESAPERYDAGIRLLSGGRIEGVYNEIARMAAGPGLRILDIGCGTGGVAIACASRGADVVGIDINAGMLAVAQAKTLSGDLGNQVEFLQLGAVEIEDRFDEESFDAVVSCLAFSEFSVEEQRYTLEIVYSRLRPGGRLVVADEVRPPTGIGRWLYSLKRAPLAAVTYVLTQTTTRPVEALEGPIRAAGFSDIAISELWSGTFQIVSAAKPK